MQLGMEQELTKFSDRKLTFKNVVLTRRDLEVFEFIIDMKFASVEDVFKKFFKVTQTLLDAKSDLWAKKRLFQLEKGKFLKAHKLYQEKATYFTATFKAYYALANIHPEKTLCKPIGGFDSRTYGHDKTVLKCRLGLEARLKITDWISDRKLRSYPELTGGLSGNYVPDGIYTLSEGVRIAFELEIARKAKSRYQEKVRKYVSLLRSQDITKRKFERVLFVCEKQTVKELLEKETKIFGDFFRVQTMDEFRDQLNQTEAV